MVKRRKGFAVDDAKNPIGRAIIELCNEQNITIRELEKRAGLTKDHIRQYILNESANCTIAFLVKIAKALNVRLNILIKYITHQDVKYQLENYDTNKRRKE